MNHHQNDSSVTSWNFEKPLINDIKSSIDTTVQNNSLKTEPGSQIHESEVTASDVLGGKGKGVAGHDGNLFYARLIKENQEEYQSRSSPKKKKQIALSIIDIIKGQDPPGRFLTPPGRNDGFMWTVKDDCRAMKKVTQALREKPKVKKKQGDGNSDSFCDTSGSLNGSMLRDSRKRTQNDRSQPNLDNAPMKKSLVGSSRRIMFKWMNSLSRQHLLNTSLHDIAPGSDLPIPEKDDLHVAMRLLSGEHCDVNREMENFETSVQDFGVRFGKKLHKAMSCRKKGLFDDSEIDHELGGFAQEFLDLMGTSAKSLEGQKQKPSTRTVQSEQSSSSIQILKEEMNQALRDEINHLRQDVTQELHSECCVSSRSLLTGNMSLMTGDMDGEDDELIVDNELRNMFLQLQSSIGKLDISSRSLEI